VGDSRFGFIAEFREKLFSRQQVSEAEARNLIEAAGGTVDRVEEGHAAAGVSKHTYPHINYTNAAGAKATVQITEVAKP
jgi:hypothetical protein